MNYVMAITLGAALCALPASTPFAALTTAESTAVAAPVPLAAPSAPTPGNDKEGVEAVAGDPGADEKPPTPDELVTDLGKVIKDWGSLGYLAGLIALLQLLMKVLKFGPIDEWFRVKRRKWIKPYIAAGLGAVTVTMVSYQSSEHILNSVVAGLLAGMGAVGWNELLNKWKVEKRLA